MVSTAVYSSYHLSYTNKSDVVRKIVVIRYILAACSVPIRFINCFWIWIGIKLWLVHQQASWLNVGLRTLPWSLTSFGRAGRPVPSSLPIVDLMLQSDRADKNISKVLVSYFICLLWKTQGSPMILSLIVFSSRLRHYKREERYQLQGPFEVMYIVLAKKCFFFMHTADTW